MAKPILLAVVSDLHANSTVAMCPPEGVRLDDGGTYQPSKVQRWQWECWEDFWRQAAEWRRATRADLWVVYNGDLVDGDHHGTTQIISPNPETQDYVVDRILSVPRALRPTRAFVVRGTEAHTGKAAAAEEAIARRIHAERAPDGAWSWYILRFQLHGTLVDCRHHGRGGARPWTEGNAVNMLAAHIFFEHARKRWPPPDLAFRSHTHRFADSHTAHPTRVIVTPAWQLKTAYVHKVAPESLADMGAVLTLFRPGVPFEVRPILYRPELPPLWQPTRRAA